MMIFQKTVFVSVIVTGATAFLTAGCRSRPSDDSEVASANSSKVVFHCKNVSMNYELTITSNESGPYIGNVTYQNRRTVDKATYTCNKITLAANKNLMFTCSQRSSQVVMWTVERDGDDIKIVSREREREGSELGQKVGTSIRCDKH